MPTEPRLPRKVEADPRFSAISELLARSRKPLWEKSARQIPELPWSQAVEQALSIAAGARKAELGIETAERLLAQEKRGLEAIQARQGEAPPHRVSRLLLVSEDGSERLYRACDKLLSDHGERLLVLRFTVSAGLMGQKVFGPGRGIKAILIADRDHVENLLLSLVKP